MTDDSNVTQLPEQGLAIDLDAATRDDEKPPFKAKVGGRIITMVDPQNIDWRDLLTMSDPREFLRLSVSEEDRKFLNQQAMEGWRFGKLMEAFYLHYDLEELAEKARRDNALAPRGI